MSASRRQQDIELVKQVDTKEAAGRALAYLQNVPDDDPRFEMTAGLGSQALIGYWDEERGARAGAPEPGGKEVYIWDRTEDDEEHLLTTVFHDDADLKDYLLSAIVGGLLELDGDGGLAETNSSGAIGTSATRSGKPSLRLVTRWYQLEDGKAYKLSGSGPLKSVTAIRQELTHLRKRREDELVRAVLDDVSGPPGSEPCRVAPELRILTGPDGRDEMVLDLVVACQNTIYVTSHKTSADAMMRVNKLIKAVHTIETKSVDPAYASTEYAAYAGKKIVPEGPDD